jgi:hypothetical protein
MENKRLFIILGVASLLLLIPFIFTQIDIGFNWGFGDFVVMGIMLYGTGLLMEGVLRKVKSTTNRVIIGGIILLVFFLVWAELAVGIFGTPFGGS